MASTTISPLVISAGSAWLGNDGNWSTFELAVGTPAQKFNVLPAIVNSEVWVPIPDGCPWPASASFNCGQSRGVQATSSGFQSKGFQTNQSSTWESVGVYHLVGAENLSNTKNGSLADDTGLYGLDTVVLGDVKASSLPGQTIAGLVTSDFWLGSFGLGIAAGQFDVLSEDVPSLLSSLKTANLTPSLSYGYTAGASYHASPGSLVVGGYDQSRSDTNSISIAMSSTGHNPLSVNVRSILLENTFDGTFAMPNLTQDLTVAIDSRISQMVLPPSICDVFQSAFGLIYEPHAGLYLLNSTTHAALLNSNPSVTLTVASDTSSNQTVNILLPYAAFDFEIGIPFYNGTAQYFPIIPSSNSSLCNLGRTFLQEAYIIVDWERSNFSISQAIHENGSANDIKTILPFEETKKGTNGLSTGAIAGIAVGGAVIGIAALVMTFFLVQRKKRSSRSHAGLVGLDGKDGKDGSSSPYPDETKARPDEIAELGNTGHIGVEANSTPIHELHGQDEKAQLMSTQLYELPAEPVSKELPVPVSLEKEGTSGNRQAGLDRRK